MKVWCVRWAGGWCAVKGNYPPPEGQNNVEAVCVMVVTLPMGTERRVPTCPVCRSSIKEKGKTYGSSKI